jgi:cob(I)alamin adenosyltransferase
VGPRIYTRSGDGGTTGLRDGSRVAKDDPRVEAYGTLDELGACVGAARAWVSDEHLQRLLVFFQSRVMSCASALAARAGSMCVSEADVELLEHAVDAFEERTGALSGFVLPGGSRAAGLLHLARTVCRRAERRIVSLAGQGEQDPLIASFINRGSDFLFAAARLAARLEGAGDVMWDPAMQRPEL